VEIRPGPAAGIVINPPDHPMPPRPVYRPLQPAELTSLEVRTEIEGQVATTSLDETFRNPNDMRVEGSYLFPLPPNAAVRDLSLFIDGKPVKCEVVEAAKARKIYEDIVRQARDPALLEYVDRDLIKIRIFPIEPHQERRIQFKYSQVLKREVGLTEYAFPLAAPQDATRAIGHLRLSGSIRSDQAIGSVYSPTHTMDFRRPDEKSATFEIEKKNAAGGRDLKIYYSTSEKDLGAALLTYRETGEKGYFLLLVSPARAAAEKRTVIPKDVTFVFDTSGSMRGEKIQQARDALKFCLKSLRPEDRFRIVRFSTDTENFSDDAKQATPDNIERAVKFVEGFDATGGTAIGDAMREALKGKSEEGRPSLIVFLTDGQPTVGETDVNRLLAGVTEQNQAHRRIFCFGAGYDVNTKLLDRLAEDNGGAADYVAPAEDIEVKVSSFFRKVADPVMTDVSLDFGKIKVSEYQPRGLPDLFAGSQTTVVGRYEESGNATVVLKGHEGKEERVFEYNVKFPEESKEADFLPRLWAIRRVGYLVEQIRAHGENAELKDEVVSLGKKFAIATPYTSLLVTEDEPVRRAGFATARPMPASTPVALNGGNMYRDSNGRAVVGAAAGPTDQARASAGAAGGASGGDVFKFSSGAALPKFSAAVPQTGAFLYDPSNGTSSNGDIVSVAGSGPLDSPAKPADKVTVAKAVRLKSDLRSLATAIDSNGRPPAAPASSAKPAAVPTGARVSTITDGYAMGQVTGEQAVAASIQTRAMKEAGQASDEKKFQAGDESNVRTLGARTFYLRAGVWTQSDYDEKVKTTDVEYGSDEYFKLAAQGGDVAKCLALGEQVIFKVGEKWYRITAAKSQ
jgi:Ca-activated chloride channel family protein